MSEHEGVRQLRASGDGREPHTGEEPAGVWACRDERPPLRTEKSGEEQHEARFALALDDIVPGDDSESQDAISDAFILEHMIAALEPGQRLTFDFRRHAESEDGPMAGMSIRGVAAGSSAIQAESGALNLHAVVRRQLATLGHCGFRAAKPDTDLLPHAYELEPEGMLVTTESKPVARQVNPVLVLPAVSLLEARMPFWDALLACAFPVQVEVTVTPAVIEGEALETLARLHSALGNRKLRCETIPERRWLNDTQVALMRGHLESALARWLVLPKGVALQATVRTAEPVPPASLRGLAQTLFPSRRLGLRQACKNSGTLQGAVDLRALLNESQILPCLLPDRLTLRRLGLPQRYPPPRERLAADGLLLGSVGGREVRLPPADRDRHCYVLGQTGCGKTSLLVNMIRADIDAGDGVVVVDPHGDLYRDVRDSIPRHRANDVVMFDPTDPDRAMGLNYLEVPGMNPSFERAFAVNELIRIFDRLYDLRRTGGPMFEAYMRNALLLLMESRIRGMTLLEVPRLFEDDDFRHHMVRHCTDDAVVRFWKRQAERATGDASLQNLAPYVTSKLTRFSGNALLRAIIGQSASTIDFRAVMDKRGILLVNLSKGALGELDAALLGMLLVSKLFLAALGRARVGREERVPCNLFVDEFQNVCTDTVADLLSEARKFGLRCVLANQHLRQIDTGKGAGNILGAVLGNVGTILAMRVGLADAQILSDLMGDRMPARTLHSLPDYHVATRMLQGGRLLDPFVFRTFAPAEPEPDPAARLLMTRNHVQRYTRDASAVRQEIEARTRRLRAKEDDDEDAL